MYAIRSYYGRNADQTLGRETRAATDGITLDFYRGNGAACRVDRYFEGGLPEIGGKFSDVGILISYPFAAPDAKVVLRQGTQWFGRHTNDIVITSYSIHYTKLYEFCDKTPWGRSRNAVTTWPIPSKRSTGVSSFSWYSVHRRPASSVSAS